MNFNSIAIDELDLPFDFIEGGRLVLKKLFFLADRLFGGIVPSMRKFMTYVVYLYGKYEDQILVYVDRFTKIVYTLVASFLKDLIKAKKAR